jgi:hypothetical protein
MRSVLIAAIVSLAFFSFQAANPSNLAMVAAKAAAAVRAAIPGSEGAVNGPVAVVKKSTWHPLVAGAPKGRMEVPDTNGVMFIIRLQHGHYAGSPLPKTPKFDHPCALDDLAFKRDIEDAERHNRTTDAFYRRAGCFHTTAVQEFPKSNASMVVDIVFGQHMNTRVLQQAYVSLTRFVENELGR